MTTFQIFLVVALKGALVVGLGRLGLWPDWEMRAHRRAEHKRVIKAYEEWCAQTGHRPAEDHEAIRKMKVRRGY